jgi:dTDP-glucose 4,6-dehydratase
VSKYLITGGFGFIGAEIANHLAEQGHSIDVLDLNTYAADSRRLKCKYTWHRVDIKQPIPDIGQFDYILHLAAETHVDNSINNPLEFVKTNVLGTANMLEFARTQKGLKLFLYFSTDEVFGPAPGKTLYKEWDRYNSGNPYSAAKAGGEELTLAYGNTYNLPIIITHTMNAFGPSQHKEKFIPNTIDKISKGETVIIHADETKEISGSRFYIHISDIAKAVEFVIVNGQLQDKYNIVGKQEVSNLDAAKMIAELLDKSLSYKMVDFHSSRPGHDLRYGLDGTKLAELGWTPSLSFKEGLKCVLTS